mgnify:FL=1
MQHYALTLKGTSPLLCHNEQLANPDNPVAKQIREITAKKKKTEADRQQLYSLEWHGSLYSMPGHDGPAIPTRNIQKCFERAATILRKGKQVNHAVKFSAPSTPLNLNGAPKDIDNIFKTGKYMDVRLVRVQSSRSMRARPIFHEWSIGTDSYLLNDVLDFDDLKQIAELAGIAEGLGDARALGYGRFTATFKKL